MKGGEGGAAATVDRDTASSRKKWPVRPVAVWAEKIAECGRWANPRGGGIAERPRPGKFRFTWLLQLLIGTLLRCRVRI